MKFQLQQKVYFNDKPWYISGVKYKFGYDMILHEYSVAQAVYGDHPFNCLGRRTDVRQTDGVREEKLMTVDEWTAQRKKILVDELEFLQRQIDQKKEELDGQIS